MSNAMSDGNATKMTTPPPYSAPPEEEVVAGQTEYLEVLRLVHQRLDPTDRQI
jgi:hypothetical protein